MKKYCANLSFQAHVPENQFLEPHFKQSIQFDILCPVSGCKKIVNKKKRGSKSAIKSGRAFQFGHNLNFMQVDWLQPASLKVDTPAKEAISRILWVTFMVFGNKSIVSNRIESLNSEFKLIIPDRGMHNENHVLNRIKRLVQLESALTVASSSRMKLPVSARVGFNNLLHFFEPDPPQIEFRKEVIKI